MPYKITQRNDVYFLEEEGEQNTPLRLDVAKIIQEVKKPGFIKALHEQLKQELISGK